MSYGHTTRLVPERGPRSALEAIRAVELADDLPAWERLGAMPFDYSRGTQRRVWLFDPTRGLGRPRVHPRPCCDECEEAS